MHWIMVGVLVAIGISLAPLVVKVALWVVPALLLLCGLAVAVFWGGPVVLVVLLAGIALLALLEILARLTGYEHPRARRHREWEELCRRADERQRLRDSIAKIEREKHFHTAAQTEDALAACRERLAAIGGGES